MIELQIALKLILLITQGQFFSQYTQKKALFTIV